MEKQEKEGGRRMEPTNTATDAPVTTRGHDAADGAMERPGAQAPSMPPKRRDTTGDHLANERTLLAWSRTGIAVMGLGFVVARFGLLLRELGARQSQRVASSGLSTAFGVFLTVSGAVLLGLALLRYLRVGQAIDRDDFHWSPWLGGAFTAILVVAGVVLAVYLLLTA